MEKPQQYYIPKLDPRLFKGYTENQSLSQARVLESPTMPIIEEIYAGKDKGLPGGIYRKLKGMRFERKCFPDPDILNRLNIVKSDITTYLVAFSTKASVVPLIVFLLQPKKWILQTFNRVIGQYGTKLDRILLIEIPGDQTRPPCSYQCYFKDTSLYCNFGREMIKFITIFLTEFGIDEYESSHMAETFALFIDYDDAYRLIMQDIFSETTKEKLLSSKELRRLGKLFVQRELNPSIRHKMSGMITLVSLALYSPWLRRCLKKALAAVDFTQFQLDEADRYYCLTWGSYDFFGKTVEERKQMYLELHKDGLAPMLNLRPITFDK